MLRGAAKRPPRGPPQVFRAEAYADAEQTAKHPRAGEERVAAWARFFAVAADSNPGELEYDRALAAAKKLDAEIATNKAA
jgi:hypothetical protein